MNRIPHRVRENVLMQAKRVSKSLVIVSVANKLSVYGVLFRKGVARRFGPEISLNLRYFKNLLSKLGFSIVKDAGFNLVPSPKLLFRGEVPSKYKFLNAYLRFLSKYKLLEDYQTFGAMKNLCTTNIFILEGK